MKKITHSDILKRRPKSSAWPSCCTSEETGFEPYINWGLGRFLLRWRERRWFPASDRQLARAEGWDRRYGRWSLLGSWLPVVGDPLTIVADILREPLVPFLILVTLAKGTRYLILASVTLAWM
jgi:membrane protein YqaA with SNARE-associated domain